MKWALGQHLQTAVPSGCLWEPVRQGRGTWQGPLHLTHTDTHALPLSVSLNLTLSHCLPDYPCHAWAVCSFWLSGPRWCWVSAKMTPPILEEPLSTPGVRRQEGTLLGTQDTGELRAGSDLAPTHCCRIPHFPATSQCDWSGVSGVVQCPVVSPFILLEYLALGVSG